MEEFLYKNIGKKIKALALWTTVFSIIVVIGIGFTACGHTDDPSDIILIPLIVALLVFVLLISSYGMYAVGQITDDLDEVVETQKEIVKLLEKKN